MKQEIINQVTKNLNYRGTTEQTKSSTRYKSFIDTEQGVADFTVIFPLTEDDSTDFKVQFNGRGSQSLNKSLGLKVQVTDAVNDALNPVHTEVGIDLRNSEDSRIASIYGNNFNTKQYQPVTNTTTKSHLSAKQRKNKRKMAKKSRKVNRRR